MTDPTDLAAGGQILTNELLAEIAKELEINNSSIERSGLRQIWS